MFIQVRDDKKVNALNVLTVRKVVSTCLKNDGYDFYLELYCVNKELIIISFYSIDELELAFSHFNQL
jgi:hypothetical protein